MKSANNLSGKVLKYEYGILFNMCMEAGVLR
jgi:hypothetical protein